MRRRRTKIRAMTPLPGSTPEEIEVQQMLSVQTMRSHDSLPFTRRIAATVVQADVGNDARARLALHIDGGRYLLGGHEFARSLGLMR